MQYADLAQSSLLIVSPDALEAVAYWARGQVHAADYWQPAELTAVPAVDEVRSLLHFAHQTPVSAVKLALVPAADQWRREVANMLLKLLEEPPAYLKLLLVGSSPLVLPTIRSRVREVVLPASIIGATAQRRTGAAGWQHYLDSLPLSDAVDVGLAGDLLYRTNLLHSTIQHDIVQEGLSVHL